MILQGTSNIFQKLAGIVRLVMFGLVSKILSHILYIFLCFTLSYVNFILELNLSLFH